MIFYTTILLVLLFASITEIYYKKKVDHFPNNSSKILKSLIIIFLFFIFLYFSINRSFYLGTDGKMYYIFYWLEHYRLYFDNGINLIYDLALYLNDYKYFLFITSLIFLVGMFISIKINTNYVWTSLFLFCSSFLYLMSFNAIRQSLAISIIFLSIYFIGKNKIRYYDFIFFIIFIFIASEFHISSWSMISLILIRFIKIPRNLIVILSALTIFNYFDDSFKNLIEPFLSSIDFYAEKYSSSTTAFFDVNKTKGLIQLLPILFQIFCLIYFLFMKNVYSNSNRNINFIVNYYFIFLFLFSFSGIEAVDRIQFYFYPSIILFYDLLISNMNLKKKVNYSLIGLILLFWSSYYILRILQNTHGIYPYEFF